MKSRQLFFGLLSRRECIVPTGRGWLLLGLAGLFFSILVLAGLHPFLAPTNPLPGGAMVVEGWEPDYALEKAVAEFKLGASGQLYVTGGPLEKGAPLSEYKTFAELGAATILHMGLSTNEIRAVPAPLVLKDRTFSSAVALKEWLREHEILVTKINVVSIGVHSRRSQLLFQKAFGGSCQVGIIAVESRDYDPKRWWLSSEGVRGVIAETLAYGYARFLFFPHEEN